MELHVVHQYETDGAGEDDYLVMALFFNVGDLESDFLRTIKYHKGSKVWGGQEKIQDDVNLNDLINPSMVDQEFLYYNGSLTTPGCNEGVNWLLFPRPQTMSSQQWNAFAGYFPDNNIDFGAKTGNYRPTQELNDRKVYRMR